MRLPPKVSSLLYKSRLVGIIIAYLVIKSIYQEYNLRTKGQNVLSFLSRGSAVFPVKKLPAVHDG